MTSTARERLAAAGLLRIVLVIVACCLVADTACHIVTGH